MAEWPWSCLLLQCIPAASISLWTLSLSASDSASPQRPPYVRVSPVCACLGLSVSISVYLSVCLSPSGTPPLSPEPSFPRAAPLAPSVAPSPLPAASPGPLAGGPPTPPRSGGQGGAQLQSLVCLPRGRRRPGRRREGTPMTSPAPLRPPRPLSLSTFPTSRSVPSSEQPAEPCEAAGSV